MPKTQMIFVRTEKLFWDQEGRIDTNAMQQYNSLNIFLQTAYSLRHYLFPVI